ncbi:MAG: zf-TFIIB domain-containing protein [Polyangiales bacterium]
MTAAPRCPRCQVAFEPFAFDAATTLDLCPRCNGAWFDAGELAQVLNTARDLRDVPDELPAAAPDAPLCPRCPGVCLVSVAYAEVPGAPHLLRCPYCEGHFAPLSSLAAMRAINAAAPRTKPRTEAVVAVRPPPAVPASVTEAVAVPIPKVDPDVHVDQGMTLRQCLLGVPVSFAVVAVVRTTGIGNLLLHGIRVSLHELGHASAAWACGNMSVPLPIGVTYTTPGRSLFVHFVVLALSGAGVWAGLRAKTLAPVLACGAYGVASLVCTWGLSEATQDTVRVFMGCGGELVLGALLVVLAHWEMPPRLQWGRFRWVVLALGACCFVSASLFWREAARDWDLIPWDAALADTGDMTRLRDDHGWNEAKITARYTALSWACLAAIVVAQLTAAARLWRRRRFAS